MRWLRRAWDGPFKTPPLAPPITVGWVLLKLFETVWRLFLILCSLAAVFAIGLWFSAQNPLSSQVGISLSQSFAEDCIAKGFPIHADIENKSSKTLGEVDIAFRVYPQGTSQDVVSYTGSHHELRSILRPGEALGWCFPMPQLEPGSTGPFTVAADVTYAAALSKDVPVTSAPPIETTATPPPLVRMSAGPQSPTPHRRTGPKTIWQSVTDLFGVIVLFMLAASSGYALIGLYDWAFKKRLQSKLWDDSKDQQGCLVIPFVGLINMALVGTGGSYILEALGWDAWLTNVDDWSWAHGLADGGMLILTGLVCQWPWLIVLLLPDHRRAAE
jgi:hypothetical protein